MNNRIKSFFTTVLLLAMVNFNCFAQLENPCDGAADPDDPTSCPLDSWVVILVIGALVFTTIRLYRIQKATASKALQPAYIPVFKK